MQKKSTRGALTSANAADQWPKLGETRRHLAAAAQLVTLSYSRVPSLLQLLELSSNTALHEMSNALHVMIQRKYYIIGFNQLNVPFFRLRTEYTVGFDRCAVMSEILRMTIGVNAALRGTIIVERRKFSTLEPRIATRGKTEDHKR